MLLLYGSKEIKVRLQSDDPEVNEYLKTSVAAFICNDIRASQITFDSVLYQAVFDAFAMGVDTDSLPDERFFTLHADPDIVKLAIDLLSLKYELSPGWEEIKIYVPAEADGLDETVPRAVLALMHRKLSALIDANQKQMKSLDDKSDAWPDLISRKMYLEKVRNDIGRRLGRILNW